MLPFFISQIKVLLFHFLFLHLIQNRVYLNGVEKRGWLILACPPFFLLLSSLENLPLMIVYVLLCLFAICVIVWAIRFADETAREHKEIEEDYKRRSGGMWNEEVNMDND